MHAAHYVVIGLAKELKKMEKKFATAIFDRKKQVEKCGLGKVEIHIYISRNERKYITIKKCSPVEWITFQKDPSLIAQVNLYNKVVESMQALGEEMTIINFDKHTGMTPIAKKHKEEKQMVEKDGFLNFMKDCMKSEKLRPGTIRRKNVVFDAVERFGRLCSFADITEKNLRDFDDWLHDGTREDISIHNYHKVLKRYMRIACEKGLLQKNPYDVCHFNKGKSKERRPLTEDELKKLMSLELNESLSRVRDLFIFSAYTGLAYADTQVFDFKNMCEKQGDTYFIDGSRVKNGCSFYTPILPPAMEVLIRYNFEVPKISNVKANLYLHAIEAHAQINKSMTTHVARHSFATLVLSHDVNIENLARMMGHRDIKTTQIYGKILKSNIHKKTEALISQLT